MALLPGAHFSPQVMTVDAPIVYQGVPAIALEDFYVRFSSFRMTSLIVRETLQKGDGIWSWRRKRMRSVDKEIELGIADEKVFWFFSSFSPILFLDEPLYLWAKMSYCGCDDPR